MIKSVFTTNYYKMEGKLLVHDDIKLYTTSDKFFMEPTINPTEIMVINRVTGEATVEPYGSVKIPIPASAYRPVCGFLGTIKLISGYYLVVAKYRILIGKINGHDIYQLAGADIIPYARTNTHLTSAQIDDNATYERMVRYALQTPGMYFSYSYDLTHTVQRLVSVNSKFHTMSMASRADPRFVWNGHLLKNFTQEQFSRFGLPLVQGFVAINNVTVNGHQLTWAVVSRRSVHRAGTRYFMRGVDVQVVAINNVTVNGHQLTWAVVSRRSVHRAGTRYFMRGVDVQGNVANYVETEQLLEKGAERASFVQTRGSIPIFWNQYPDLQYKPAMGLSADDHVAACSAHLTDQHTRYGPQVLLNLIDHRGKEQVLERGYKAAVAAAALPEARYEPFDFHAECRGMRYERLNVLIDRVQHEQKEFGYTWCRGATVVSRQWGVFRTNCVDCLDRTNVLQSMLARIHLKSALAALAQHQGDQLPPTLDRLFNNVWADHADMISIQYSGTGALKTDITRIGKRTRLGLMNDAINSLTRYYKNNFADGFRQDSIDLFLGNYTVQDGEGNNALCPLRKPKDWKYITFPSVLMIAMSMFCASAIVPKEYTSEVLMYILFWGAAAGAMLSYIFKHGKDFVDWPRLSACLLEPPSSL